MAKPIKETPILKGQDAVRFQRQMANSVKISDDARKKMQANFDKIQSISRF